MISSVVLLTSVMLCPSDAELGPRSCGESSCYLLMALLGREDSIETVVSRFTAEPHDKSFGDIQAVLQSFGVNTLGYHVSWTQFRHLRGPVICQINAVRNDLKHFHVALWIDEELVVLDPVAVHPIRIPPEQWPQYQKVFEGNVLVPTNQIPWTWRVFRSRSWSIGIAFVASVFAIVCWRLAFIRRPNVNSASRGSNLQTGTAP